ncbi:MAG: hypothetical protein K1X88_04175 [Nannocystaceae bacterium]|nr:hypothetical protein [Nannocystaceae bacterium]
MARSQLPVVGVLSNPNSGKNRRQPGRRRELERAVGSVGIVRQTRDLAELEAVLDEFLDAGCRYWVCDGGDGTLHWMLSVADARVRARREAGHETPWPRVVPGNGGSIDFVAHKAGIRGDAVQLLRVLVHRVRSGVPLATVPIDTMRVQGTRSDGSAFDHLGFASALGGIAQRFFDKLYARGPVDAWSIAHVIGRSTAGAVANSTPGLGQLVPSHLREYAGEVFEPTMAQVDVDGRPLPFSSFASLQVGSIDISLGGVVRTFRHAAASGVLHAQAISTSPLGIVANLPNIVLGTPIWGRNVFDGAAQRMRVRAIEDHTLDPVIDGELFRGFTALDIGRGPVLDVPVLCAA